MLPKAGIIVCMLAAGLYPAAASQIDRTPKIYPDYAGITIPPNIAPLNFIVEEQGSQYRVVISGENGKPIRIKSRSGKVIIPQRKWRNLLEGNRGKPLQIVIAVQDKGQWREFRPILNRVADEPISETLVYRLIKPLYVYWKEMGIYERDLTGFDERPILLNRTTGDNCVNCHAFADQRSDRMLLHLRAGAPGTAMLLAEGGKVRKIDTSTEFNRAVAYRDWHPSGKWIAFSANTVNQFFHAVGENRDVYDKASDLVLYDIENNRITGSPKTATEMMETYPEWSPDGRTLYFCRTDPLEKYDPSEHPYRKIKYDLMRIACDPEKGLWGEVEPVFEASRLGKSVTHPKVSPDGRYLLFCLAEYGNFSIYRPDSDLYLLDLHTGQVRDAWELNSDKSESYHCWDADGHWVVFSSKREDGLCARPFFSRFDGRGFSKPFVLPQKDPAIYRRLLKTYNVPELVSGKVSVDRRALLKAAWSRAVKAKLDPELGRRAQDEADEMWKPVPKP
ncbi:MAG: hypothetical protein ONB12_04940 [candidate division KSB1 bacterium]|nr:hypothetical protein [candidate division KSB1 bacterium]